MGPEKPPTRVLVVEDEPLFRWALVETLHDGGFEVAEAADGRSTIEELVAPGHRAFDVVLLDYHLPDSDDLELLTLVKQACPESAVIMMSAFTTPEMQTGALERGADAVLSKPFDLSAVAPLVETVAH